MNTEHVSRLLGEGVNAWNEWRRANDNVWIDLSGADLSSREMAGVLLRRTDLSHANLAAANLYGANMSGAQLYRANLRAATLVEAELSGATLVGADLRGACMDQAAFHRAYLTEANLTGASLRNAFLSETSLAGNTLTGSGGAILEKADLGGANLRVANLMDANLRGADLTAADLYCANLTRTDLSNAILHRANLENAVLIHTCLEGANIADCNVYGLSAWGVRLEGAQQQDLVITPADEATITVDNLEVAQFIYLILNNRRIREVVDTITSKVVLILGRFTAPRMAVLEALRRELRQRDYLPVLFDFDAPTSRDITETVSTIAHMSRFVIADITDARSIPQELMAIVPNLPSVPVQPIMLASQEEYGMFGFFRRFPWVMEPYLYADESALLAALSENVIAPPEARAREQRST